MVSGELESAVGLAAVDVVADVREESSARVDISKGYGSAPCFRHE